MDPLSASCLLRLHAGGAAPPARDQQLGEDRAHRRAPRAGGRSASGAQGRSPAALPYSSREQARALQAEEPQQAPRAREAERALQADEPQRAPRAREAERALQADEPRDDPAATAAPSRVPPSLRGIKAPRRARPLGL